MKPSISILCFWVMMICSLPAISQHKQIRKQPLFLARNSDILSADHKKRLAKTFFQYQLMQIDLGSLFQLTRSQKNHIDLKIGHGSSVWDISLHENDLRSVDYIQEQTTANGRIQIPRDACGTFAGVEKNDPNSFVRMNVREHSFSALFFIKGQFHYMELLNKFLPDMGENLVVIYSNQDVIPVKGFCGGGTMLQEIEHKFQQIEPKVKNKMNETNNPGQDLISIKQNATPQNNINPNFEQYALSTQAVACRKLDIVTDSDYDNYTSCCGLYVDASDILDNLNNVEPLFLSQFGVKFHVRYQHQWTVSNDPYTETDVCDNSYDRLEQFRDYWDNTSNWFYNNLHKDVAILYSGINFDGSPVGCAFTGTISNTFQGQVTEGIYMIVQSNDYQIVAVNWTTASFTHLTGHELGHIFGATHDASSNYLMSPVISTINTWSSQSISQINTKLASYDVQQRLGTRYIITPFNVPFFGGIFNGGEVYIRASASNSAMFPFSFEGVDHCTVQGTSTISSSNTGGITIKTAPCSNGGF